MAKAKKETLSLEELLEEAIVKEEDRPYEVPWNWVWINFENIVEDTKLGLVRSSKEQSDDYTYNYLKMNNISINGELDLNDIVNVEATETEIETFSLKLGDFLFNTRNSRELVGKNTVVKKHFDRPMLFNNNIMRVRFISLVNPRLVSYFLNSPQGLLKLDEVKKVTTNVAAIYARDLNNIAIPIPPIAEQQRIVEVVESLFEKLDTAKELVQNALDSFESRKAAILHKAFTGELTARWREENGVSLEAWEEIEVGKLCDCIVPGRDKPKSFTGNIPWITIPNLEGDYISINSAALFLTEEEINEVRAKIIPVGSVVMTCVGRFGISAIVENECVINQQLHAFLPSDLINNRFLMYNIRYLKDYMVEKATSTTIAYLNKTACNSLPINLPTLLEQQEIVRILDSLLENEQRAMELCDVIEKIDLMKKAILARAFRGELGTNNPEEESAVELLKEVLKEKN
jgi:type I restriction enzyme S subunit